MIYDNSSTPPRALDSAARQDPALINGASEDQDAQSKPFPTKPLIALPMYLRRGRCYELAHLIATKKHPSSEGWKLVHGALLEDGLWLAHCWTQTESEGEVFVFDPVTDLLCPEVEYLPGSAPRKMAVYSSEMAQRLKHATGHFGPWLPYWQYSLGQVNLEKLARDWKAQHIAINHYFRMIDRGMLPDLAREEWE